MSLYFFNDLVKSDKDARLAELFIPFCNEFNNLMIQEYKC